MATPAAPNPPAPAFTNVASPLRTITVTNETDLEAYLNGTDTTLAGGAPSGGPKFGDDVVMTVTTYNSPSTLNLPAPTGNPGGGTGIVAVSARPAITPRAVSARPANSAIRAMSSSARNYVTFRGASQALLPAAGAVINKSDASNMPRLNVASGSSSFFTVNDNVSQYRVLGLNFTVAAGVTAYGFLQFQSPSNTVPTHANYMLVDRCLFHGDPTVLGPRLGVQGCGAHHAIINSRFYDFTVHGGEWHNILWPTGTGPYLVQNCELEAASCGIFIGDSVPAIVGTIPGDITVKNNWIHQTPKRNVWSYVYKTGTAAISSDGLTVTITGGTVSAGWANTYNFTVLDAGNRVLGNNFDYIKPVTAVNTGANTLTLGSAFPVLHGSSGLAYRITLADNSVPYGFKNLIEMKHGKRLLVQGNLFDTAMQQSQTTALVIASVHGDQAGGYDINVKDNYIKNITNPISFLARPSVGQGTQWSSQTFDAMPSGPRAGRVRVTTNNGHNAFTGDTADIYAPTGCTEASGVWTITVESSTTFTIPVTWVHSGDGTEQVVIWQSGYSTSRVAVTNNVIEDTGSDQTWNAVNNTGTFAGQAAAITINNAIDLSDSSLALDGTGAWNMHDWLIEHNTVVSPTANSHQNSMLRFTNSGIGGKTYTILPIKNFTMRNNAIRQAESSYSYTSAAAITSGNAVGAVTSNGKAALDVETESASRSFTNNAFFDLAQASVNSEPSLYSAPESTSNAWVAGQTNVGFTSYVAGTVTNYALANLWTGTCNVSAATPAVLTSPSVNFPTTIVAGTPFKVNSDGTFVLVASRDSSTQITLAAAYPTTGNTLTSTLGFRGWATDGADVGADTSVVAAALALVPS